MKEKILIIGSNGILGKHIVEKVISSFGVENIVLSDYKETRLNQQKKQINAAFGIQPSSEIIDVDSEDSIKKGLNNVCIVVIAIQQKKPLVQKICIDKGIHSIDLSVNSSYINETLNLNSRAQNRSLQLITAGLFPGFSGLLAKKISEDSILNEPVDIGLLQSVNGTNGKTGVADMLQIFDMNVALFTTDSSITHSGYSHAKQFAYPHPFGIKTLRLANFIERDYLKNYGINSNYWTSFDKEQFNSIIVVLKKLQLLKLFKYSATKDFFSSLISKQNKGDRNEFIGLSGKNSKKEISIILSSDYEATASCATAFVKIILSKDIEIEGVKFPFEIFTFEELTKHLNDVIIEIHQQ